MHMNFDQVQGAALELVGELKKRWAAHTGDDALALEAARDIFLGKLRQRSGEDRQGVERKLTDLLARVELTRQRRGGVSLDAV